MWTFDQPLKSQLASSVLSFRLRENSDLGGYFHENYKAKTLIVLLHTDMHILIANNLSIFFFIGNI